MEGGRLTGGFLTTFTFGSKGEVLTQLVEETFDSPGTNVSLDSITYNENGRITSELEEIWTNGQWVNQSLNTTTYDAQGQESSILGKAWKSGQWVNSGSYDNDLRCGREDVDMAERVVEE